MSQWFSFERFLLTFFVKVRRGSGLFYSWAISWRASTSVELSSFSRVFPTRMKSKTGSTSISPPSSLRWSPVVYLGRLHPKSGQDTGLSDSVLTIITGVDYSLLPLNPCVRLRGERTSIFEMGMQPLQDCVPLFIGRHPINSIFVLPHFSLTWSIDLQG